MNLGYRKRSDQEEMELRVRMLQSTHQEDIYRKSVDELGGRGGQIGPLDATRNPAVRYTAALATAYTVPPACTGLSAGLATAIGDSTSRVLAQKYAMRGYRPMPTVFRDVAREAERYLVFCHYVGIRCDWSRRLGRPTVALVTPDDVRVEYDADTPGVPVRIRHEVMRRIGVSMQTCTDEYDLSDLDNPRYRVLRGTQDVTDEAIGGSHSGASYDWRYSDGAPFCPIVIYGHAHDLSRGLEIVEATLRVSVGWSWWWAGLRDACNKGRNVRGMVLAGADSALGAGGQGTSGVAIGPEDVARWVDDDGDKPGEHWQWDSPFDAEAHGRAIASYETSALSQMGFPVDLTQTGGEPLAYELEARRLAAQGHYDQLRAGDAEVFRVLAAITNSQTASTLAPTDYEDLPGTYGIDYYQEIDDGDDGNSDGGDGKPETAKRITGGAGEAGDPPGEIPEGG